MPSSRMTSPKTPDVVLFLFPSHLAFISTKIFESFRVWLVTISSTIGACRSQNPPLVSLHRLTVFCFNAPTPTAVLGEGNTDNDDHCDGLYSGHGYPVARTLVRASTAPVPQVSQTLEYTPLSHPRVLTPGFHNVKPGVHTADLFFTSPTSPMNFDHVFSSGPSSPDVPYKSHPYAQPNTPSLSPPPVPPHPYHLRRSVTSPPPIPPKSSLPSRLPPSIALYPHVISHPVSAPITFPVPERNTLPPLLETLERIPAPPAVVDGLEIDIATSRSESGEQQKLLNQEDEDLARALKESIISAASPRCVQVSLSNQDIAGPDSQPSTSTSGVQSTESNGLVTDKWRSRSSYSVAQIAEDEAFARRLAEEEDEEGNNPDPAQVASSSSHTLSGNGSLYPASNHTVQLDDDAAFARKLALEEEDGYTPLSDGPVQTSPLPSGPTELPRYVDVLSSTSSTSIAVGGKGGGLALPPPDLIRSNSSSSSTSITSGSDTQSLSGRSISSAPYLHPQRRPLSSASSTRPLSSTSLAQLEEVAEDDLSPSIPRSANQFIDADLLLGVCECLYSSKPRKPLMNLPSRWFRCSFYIVAITANAGTHAEYYITPFWSMSSSSFARPELAACAQINGQTQWHKDRAHCRSHGSG